jgi:hypothetical protein
MKVFKMDKVEILRSEIRNKISFIEDQILKSKKHDTDVINKIPDYLNTISRLEKENLALKTESEKLNQEHSTDLKEVEGLVEELSNLMEGNNA